jgi:hypothetical protein
LPFAFGFAAVFAGAAAFGAAFVAGFGVAAAFFPAMVFAPSNFVVDNFYRGPIRFLQTNAAPAFPQIICCGALEAKA